MYKMLILMLLAGASSTGCASDRARLLAAHKETQASATLVRSFYDDVWNEGRGDAAEKYLAPDFVRHDHRAGTPPPGPEGQALIVQQFRAGFPDARLTIDQLVAEGPLVAARWTITGTHTGEWNGLAPTGTTIQYSGMTLFRLAGGKIVETWNH